MIRTENLTKLYTMNGKTLAALDHVSLHVEKGEYTAIVGPSGSGKSTLMHILGCLDTPTSGQYFLHGKDVSTLGQDELARVRGEEIGFVFQGFQLLPRLTAQENVALPLMLCGVPPQERMAAARDLLEQVGLGQRLRHTPSQLSGGQQQRVAIARALALKPDILCFDEPTSALDPELSGEVLKTIRGLAEKKMTMMIVTHEMGFARDVSSQVLFMDDGKILERGEPHALFDNPQTERLKSFLAAVR